MTTKKMKTQNKRIFMLVALAVLVLLAVALVVRMRRKSKLSAGDRIAQILGKVRPSQISMKAAPVVISATNNPFVMPLTMVDDVTNDPATSFPVILMSMMALEFQTETQGTVPIDVQVDTGSIYLLLMGTDCKECDLSHGAFPARCADVQDPSGACKTKCDAPVGSTGETAETGPDESADFLYGIGEFCGTYSQTHLTIGSGTMPLELAAATSAQACFDECSKISCSNDAQCISQFCDPNDTSCNAAIGGLLPLTPSQSHQSFVEQLLSSIVTSEPNRNSFILDYRKGQEQLAIGMEDSFGTHIPLLSDDVLSDLELGKGIPYYLVEVKGASFQPATGAASFSVPVPQYAILDSGTTLMACSSAFSGPIRDLLVAAGGAGTLFLDLGGAYLAATFENSDVMDATFPDGPGVLPDSAPFNKLLLVGIIAMLGNVISHNIDQRYVTIRQPECYPIGGNTIAC